jgi:prepilin peptidase CpaA
MPVTIEGPLLQGVSAFAFATMLAMACVADLRTRRIPNALVLVTFALGMAQSIVHFGVWQGGGRAAAGMLTGLAIWLPFWLLRMMGGGDVKLFAAGAAWLGVSGAVEGALLAGLCGGVLSLAYMLYQHGLSYTIVRVSHGMQQPSTLREASSAKWSQRMPYALAMSAGLALAAWRPGLLQLM